MFMWCDVLLDTWCLDLKKIDPWCISDGFVRYVMFMWCDVYVMFMWCWGGGSGVVVLLDTWCLLNCVWDIKVIKWCFCDVWCLWWWCCWPHTSLFFRQTLPKWLWWFKKNKSLILAWHFQMDRQYICNLWCCSQYDKRI